MVGILGARVFYVIHYLSTFLQAPNPILAMINLTAGGLEFYGGFLLAVLAVFIYLRVKKLSFRWYMDILAPSIMIGLAFGRVGCFLNGCCWGATTQVPWAVSFPYGSPPYAHQWTKSHELDVPAEFMLPRNANDGMPILIEPELLALTDQQLRQAMEEADPATAKGKSYAALAGHLQNHNLTMADLHQIAEEQNLRTLPVHPTQVYSSINALLIAWVLGGYFWRRKRHGMVICWLFVIYPISRFLLELIRTDNPQDTFGLTISQGISLAVVPLAVLMMLYLRRLPEVSLRAVAEMQARAAAAKKNADT